MGTDDDRVNLSRETDETVRRYPIEEILGIDEYLFVTTFGNRPKVHDVDLMDEEGRRPPHDASRLGQKAFCTTSNIGRDIGRSSRTSSMIMGTTTTGTTILSNDIIIVGKTHKIRDVSGGSRMSTSMDRRSSSW